MPFSGMLRRVTLVRTDVSEENSASITMVIRIGELGTKFLPSVPRLLVTANVVPSSPILVTLLMRSLPSSETDILTRATRRNIPEDGFLYSHHRENLKSYIYPEYDILLGKCVYCLRKVVQMPLEYGKKRK
jgi:hypothetical protein